MKQRIPTLDEFINEGNKLFTQIENTGKLKDKENNEYELTGADKDEWVRFTYDKNSKNPFGVTIISGYHLPSDFLSKLGFYEKRNWTAGVEVYVHDGNYQPKWLSNMDMKKLITEWSKGFKSYAKSFAAFYKNREKD